ncbi:MAG: PRK06851 family protein [Bacillota bacterium]
MAKGNVKKVFPGNNTSAGFYSFYDYIIKPDARRIFVIKGGPGVGKSTMMKNIGEALLEKGFDVEFHCCSSDNGSLDGVVIPSLNVALIDGTAPHIVDPKNPGAVDEIVHLGDYWNEEKMVEAKEEIIRCNKRVGRLFKIAYSYLKEARVAHDELASYYEEATDWGAVNKLIWEIKAKLFAGVTPRFEKTAEVRRLFASANTPGGPMNYIETILRDVKQLYVLQGEPGTGMEKLLDAVLEEGVRLGLDCEAYHCPFDPDKLELLYYPKLRKAVLRLTERLDFEPQYLPDLQVQEVFDFNEFVNPDVAKTYAEEIADAKRRIRANFQRAWKKIKEAKAVHDDMEKYYIPAMDFAAINKKKEEILQRILSLTAVAAK